MDAIHLGIGGVAIGLTIALWYGTGSGGKFSLSWAWTLFLAMVAGCAYKAAGEPFTWISDLVLDGSQMAGGLFQKLTMAGIAMGALLIVLFRKNSLRGVAMLGIIFTTVAADAGGPFGYIAGRFEYIAMYWA